MEVLEIPEPTQKYLKEKADITNIGRLVSTSDEDWDKLREESEGVIKIGHLTEFKSFKRWINTYIQKNGVQPSNWTAELTEEIWDLHNITRMGDSMSEISIIPKEVTTKENPTMLNRMKIDIKAYPTFSGKLNDWKSFKRQFTAVYFVKINS